MTKLQDEFNKFYDIAKLMNKTNISKNPETLNRYRKLIVPAYNRFVKFISDNYFGQGQSNQYIFDDALERVRNILIKCLDNIGCTYELPADLKDAVNEESVSQIIRTNRVSTTASTSSSTSSSILSSPQATQGATGTNSENLKIEQVEVVNNPLVTVHAQVHEVPLIGSNLDENLNNSLIQNLINTGEQKLSIDDNHSDDNNSDDNNSDDNNSSDNEDNMAPISTLDLFNAVNQQFKKTYSGDPLALNTFLDGVDIVTKFAPTVELKADLFDYLKAKLEGRAREFVTDDIDNVDDLKRALTTNIKPENSKVIEGRIATLRYSFSKQEEFSTRAEELADSLRRTLIIEGMTER